MAEFLLEVGTEELPADFVASAIQQWQKLIPVSLEEHFLNYGKVNIYGTPRRLAILITDLPPQQPDREEEIKGPPAQAAFKDGQPTKAAEGFARKQGVALTDLEIRPTAKGDFVFINKKIPGIATGDILKQLIPVWISRLEGRRFMRWGDGDLRFPRPIRTLVALLDEQTLPVDLVSGSSLLNSDRNSPGHRVLHPEPIVLQQPGDYISALSKAGIIVDPQERGGQIQEQIQTIAKEMEAIADISPDLLEEVIYLVESPTAVVGKFDSEFLELPPEVIITVMVSHQRYFPLKKADGSLLPNFITISNGDRQKNQIIAAGNERVIRARLADAQFFYKADCDEHLESYLPQLENVTFQEKLGSMRDKVDRIMEITQQITDQLQVNEKSRKITESAAMLCKADLVTQMVYEFPELQGVMGEKYALVSGESPEVAKAIFEHYLPRGADDLMPTTLPGQIVGLADRLDTLVSIFGLGMIPSGSSDPFALRRAANAMVNIIWQGELEINLAELIEQTAQDFVTAHPDQESPETSLREFFRQRIRTLLQDELNIDYDLVNAVLGESDSEYLQRALENLLDVRDRAQFLQTIRNNGSLDTIYETVNRSTRLAEKGELDTQQLDPQGVINSELFEKPSEKSFYEGLLNLVPQTETAQAQRNYQLLVDALAQIAPTVANFFDGEDSVMVMAENPDIRRNRLNLLGILRNNARILGDFAPIIKS